MFAVLQIRDAGARNEDICIYIYIFREREE
jgi:hypothetical protein